MTQMPSTVRADDLYPLHAERLIAMPGHRTWNGVEECRPAAAGLKLLVGAVEWRIAGGAIVGAGGWLVLVVFTAEGCFGAFLADDTELFCCGLLAVVVDIKFSSKCLPGLNTACHSLSLFCTGCDIFLVSAVWNRAPKNGIVGIEALRAAGRTACVKGDGVARIVVLPKA